MLEMTGNLWALAAGSNLVLTTNGVVKKDGGCVMGRGIALEAKTRFPEIQYMLGNYINQWGNRSFNLGQWQSSMALYRIISMPVKHKWNEQADINLIIKSCHQLVSMANKFGWDKLYLPRPGCGNGSLDWNNVKPVIEVILDDRFIVCTFK